VNQLSQRYLEDLAVGQTFASGRPLTAPAGSCSPLTERSGVRAPYRVRKTPTPRA
jgi:hypothetical protein